MQKNKIGFKILNYKGDIKINQRKRKKKKGGSFTEQQKTNVEAQVYNNDRKCDSIYTYTYSPIVKEVGGFQDGETHAHPWLIHVNVWQNQLQYCKVISLQTIKIIGGKKGLRERARQQRRRRPKGPEEMLKTITQKFF